MNLVNSIMGSLIDVLMTPFELLGSDVALILVSGVFGILALIAFKQISWQGGIKGVKDKIKGNMIAIRLYQDDLVIVTKSVISVLLRNFQYLGLNFGPMVPLLVPFVLVLSQLVVRYAYDPLPVHSQQEIDAMMSGEGTIVTIEMTPAHRDEVRSLALRFPDGIETVSKLVRIPAEGKAWVEIAAGKSVDGEIEVLVDGQVAATKAIVAGDDPGRPMQGTRSSSFWEAWLFPAEETLPEDGKIASISFEYPSGTFAFLPGGEGGVLLVFLVASMAFGIAVLKPLNIQI